MIAALDENETRVPGADEGSEQRGPDTVELLALIDRLEALLHGSELTELEVEAGGTALVLRTPQALAPVAAVDVAGPSGGDAQAERERTGRGRPTTADAGHQADEAASTLHAVLAPLTGIFYRAPTPEAAPYVREGGEVVVGQVIGLIEAMKLYNEIKSDVAGRVVRITAENGALVKAKQPLIEVEPL